MKSTPRVGSTVSISYINRIYVIVQERSQVLHPTSEVHIRYHTIVIGPIRFKYESYMVQYGYSRSHAPSYGLPRSLCVYKAHVCSYALEHNEKHNCCHTHLLIVAQFILEWSYFSISGLNYVRYFIFIEYYNY